MKKIILGLIFFAGSSCISAQTISDFLSVPFPSSLKASKDGKKIAFVMNDKGVRNIHITGSGGNLTKVLTNNTIEDGMDLGSLQFSPNGDRMVFVKGNSTNSKGEPANPAQLQSSTARTIWIADLSTDSIKKMGAGYSPVFSPDGRTIAYLNQSAVWTMDANGNKPGERLFSTRGAQSSIRWSPDGNKLAFVSARGDHSYIGIFDFKTNSHSFVESTTDNDIEPAFSRDGNMIAWIRVPYQKDVFPFIEQKEGLPWSIHIKDLRDGRSRSVWKADPGRGSVLFNDLPVTENLLIWTGENKLIFPWEKDGWVHMYQLDPENGKANLVTPGDGEIENVSLSADGQTLFYTTNIGDIDRRHIWKRDLKTGQNIQVTKGNGIEWSPVLTENGIIVLRSTAITPAWPARVNPDGSLSDIDSARFPSGFPKSKLAEPKAVVLSAQDGLKIPAQLFYPKDHRSGEKHPALIFFHGGSRRQMLLGFNYGMYYSHAYALNQFFTSKGYVVLSVNYRSGIGYGLDFREALNYGANGGSEFNDVIAAGRFLQGMKDVDAKRIALWGGSYGGYLTAMGLARASDMFACGVDIHGVHDWNVVVKNFAPDFDTEKHASVARKARESSPLHYMSGWRSPVLLIHGDDDRNVPFSETVDIAEQLRKHNVPFEQLIFPDEVHSFLMHSNWLKAFQESYRFISEKFKQ